MLPLRTTSCDHHIPNTCGEYVPGCVHAREMHGDLYVMNADGSAQTRLTTSQLDPSAPSWSPDGRSIAFAATPDRLAQIFVVRAGGTGQTQLTAGVEAYTQPAWSPRAWR